jgi:exopolysaccharide production protein ExoQ
MNARGASLHFFEKVFVVVVILLSTGALLPLLHRETSAILDVIQGDRRSQIVWASVYGITILLVAMRWRQVAYTATRDKLLLLLLGIAIVSVLWSVAPELTLRRSVALVGTTLFGAYLATRYSTNELLRLLAWALGIVVLLSIVFALALPSYGIYTDPRGEAWRGIYWHKNALGRTMALSAMVFLFLALSSRSRRWIAWACFGLSVALLLLSESITSLAVLLIILALLPLYKALRWRSTPAVPFYVIAILSGGVAIAWLGANAEDILSALGRDLTLSGRTELWSAVLEMIRQRPWLGYGYRAFWLGWTGESAHVWLWMLRIGANYEAADNGFLDLWLYLGLLGVLVFAYGFVRAFLRAVTRVRLTKTAEGLWPLALLTFILFYNLAESAILAHNNVLWILYVQASLSVAVLATTVNDNSSQNAPYEPEGRRSYTTVRNAQQRNRRASR